MAYTWENTPVISQINAGGTSYYIKDAEARTKLDALSSATHFIGKTTSELTEGSATNPVVIDGSNVTAQAGDIVYVERGLNESEVEFIFNGTKWQELGSTSVLGKLAFKDEASTAYTPVGTVSQPTFIGTENQEISVSGVAIGNITSAAATEFGNYTPSGTIDSPNITVTPTVATGKLVINAGTASDYSTLPSLTTDVQGEVLTISFDTGTFTKGTTPTLEDTPTALTGVTAALATNPQFTGNAVDITFTGTSFNSTGTFTPEGTVSQPTFSGTKATITVS